MEDRSYSELSFGQLLRRFASQSSIYTFGTFALQFGSIILTPIYWRYLEPADYGILAIAAIVQTFLSTFLNLGLYESVTRFYYEWPAAERKRYLGAIWLLFLANSLLVTLTVYNWGAPLFNLAIRQVPFDPYLKIKIWSAFFLAFYQIPLKLLRVREKAKLYTAFSIVTFLTGVIFSIYFVVVRHEKALGMLKGELYAAMILAFVYFTFMLKQVEVVFSIKYVKKPLAFCLPLIPSAIINSTRNILDKFLLEKYIPLHDLGIYSIGNTVGRAFHNFSRSLKTAWVPFYMRLGVERRDAHSVIARVATYYVAILAIVALSLSLISREIIILFGKEKYIQVYSVVPAFIVAYLFLGFQFIVGSGIGIAKRTKYVPIVAGVAFAVSLGGNVLLIPRIGAYGAIFALVLTNLALSSTAYYFSNKFYPVPYEWGRLGKLFLVAIGVFLFGYLVGPANNLVLAAALKIVLISLYTVAISIFVLDGKIYLRRLWHRGELVYRGFFGTG